MSGNKYIILKGNGAKPTVPISSIVADCNLGLCVNTKPGDDLPSILRKICDRIKKTDGTHLAKGDNINITGSGTETDPYVISATTSGGGSGLTSIGLVMPEGFIVHGSPLTSNGNIEVTTPLNGIIKGDGSGFGVVLLGDGLTYDDVTETLSLTESRHTHTQLIPTNQWTVNHALGKKCLVEVFINEKQVFADVQHLDNNTLKINFTNNQIGYAICKI